MTKLCRAQLDAANTADAKSLCDMAKDSPASPPPEREISTITIVVPPSNISAGAVPSISLTAAAGDWPTMSYNTFIDIDEPDILRSKDIQIVFPFEKKAKKRHRKRRGKRCSKCCEAAWANAYFGEAMKKEEFVEVKRKEQDAHEKKCYSSQDIKESESVEDSRAKDGTGLEIDKETQQWGWYATSVLQMCLLIFIAI